MQLKVLYGLLVVLTLLTARPINADLLDCDDKKLPEHLSEIRDMVVQTQKELLPDEDVAGIQLPIDGIDESISDEMHQLREFLKKIGCKLKSGASKVGEQAKKLGVELKENAKKLSARAKHLGSTLKTRFNDFKVKFSRELETVEEEMRQQEEQARNYMSNVELINPDILKAEQLCGHGHILDALGKCSKLRK